MVAMNPNISSLPMRFVTFFYFSDEKKKAWRENRIISVRVL